MPLVRLSRRIILQGKNLALGYGFWIPVAICMTYLASVFEFDQRSPLPLLSASLST